MLQVLSEIHRHHARRLSQRSRGNSEIDKRASLAQDPSWWFRPLENNARFRELVGATQ